MFRSLLLLAALTIAGWGGASTVSETGQGAEEPAEPVPYFISNGDQIAGHTRVDNDLARLAFAAWTRESEGRLQFVESRSVEDARIRVEWVSADSGLFGLTRRVDVGGRAGAVVFVTPEVTSLDQTLARRISEDPLLRHAIVYLTVVHELGHALGLEHTADFEDIMYSFGFGGDIVEYFMRYRRNLTSIEDIGSYSGLSAGDRSRLRRIY